MEFHWGVSWRDSLRSTHPQSSVHLHSTLCTWIVELTAACWRSACTHCACTEVCTMCTLSNTPWLLQEDGAWQRLGVTGAGNTWIRQMGAAFDKHSLPNTAPCHIPPILFLILRLCISYALLGWLAGRLEAVTPILRSGLKRVTNLKRLDPGLIRICSFQ